MFRASFPVYFSSQCTLHRAAENSQRNGNNNAKRQATKTGSGLKMATDASALAVSYRNRIARVSRSWAGRRTGSVQPTVGSSCGCISRPAMADINKPEGAYLSPLLHKLISNFQQLACHGEESRRSCNAIAAREIQNTP